MKKLLMLISLVSVNLMAQDFTDAVRFSTDRISGTARYTAMSGAFGALGGDISGMSLNPAGSAVFLNNKMTASLDLTTMSNESMFGDGSATQKDSSFDLNQAGAVFVFTTNNENALFEKLSFGIAYQQTNNYDNETFVTGNNSQSISNYFMNFAQGVELDLLVPVSGESVTGLYEYLGENIGFGAQQAYLGYEAFMFDADNPGDFGNTSYTSNVNASAFTQNYQLTERGSAGKYIFNFGGEINKRFYLGVNLNAHVSDYERTTLYDEFNSASSGVNEIYFDNTLRTRTRGFSTQLGGIAKVTDNWRIGATYQSPTWITVSDEMSQRLETVSVENGNADVNPNVLNIYSDYKFKTPEEWNFSTAYVFGSSGLISFDYGYKDFSQMKFRSGGFEDLNAMKNQVFKSSVTYRLGGEYRIANYSLRGGYFSQESPYKNELIHDDVTGFSFGIGYSFGNSTSLDFSYMRTEQNRSDKLYQTGLSQRAEIDAIRNNFVLSLTFGL
ncbi:MAG: OmpP1/FadL family transporter [Psychroflexus sp.]